MLSYRFRKKKTYKKRIGIRLLILLLILIVVIVYMEKQISRFCLPYIQSEAQKLTTNAVCDAVEAELSSLGYGYSDLAKVNYADGKVSSIETNANNINQLKTRVVKAAEKEAEKFYRSEVAIPLGAFTKLTLLNNVGPDIWVTFSLTGSFTAELKSTFESAGINQTIHHIRLFVTSKIVTASLDYEDTMTFTTDFEIAQTVIVGSIPTTYGGYYTAIQ